MRGIVAPPSDQENWDAPVSDIAVAAIAGKSYYPTFPVAAEPRFSGQGYNGNEKGIKMKRFLFAAALALTALAGSQGAARDTDLHRAAQNGDINWARHALDHGVYVDARDENEMTPLHLAAGHGYADIARMLLDAGANANSMDRYEMTPLHWAALLGYTFIVRMLLEAGANANVEDWSGSTPLRLAEKKRHADVVRVLRDAGGR